MGSSMMSSGILLLVSSGVISVTEKIEVGINQMLIETFFSRGLQCARSVLLQSEGAQLLCYSHGRHLHLSFHLQRSNPLPVHLLRLAHPMVRHRRRQLRGGGDQWVGRL